MGLWYATDARTARRSVDISKTTALTPSAAATRQKAGAGAFFCKHISYVGIELGMAATSRIPRSRYLRTVRRL